jgi:hypothetical protein
VLVAVGTTRVFAVLLAAALAAGGCGTPASPAAAPKSGGSSPVQGWPQGASGVLDEKMCPILTADDFAKYDRVATDKVEAGKLSTGGNGVVCNYALDDTLTLELAANHTDATLTYAARTADVKGGTTPVTGLVKGAQASWYHQDARDTSGNPGDSELVAMRGALIVEIHLQGWYPGGKNNDLKAISAGLAGLVFERAPDLGKTADTASGAPPAAAHTVIYRVKGIGSIQSITYVEPIGLKFQTVKNVKAPWLLNLPLAGSQVGQQVMLNLTANSADPNAQLACEIQIDDKVVAHETKPGFITMCDYTWKG